MIALKYLAVTFLCLVLSSGGAGKTCTSCGKYDPLSDCKDPYTYIGPLSELCDHLDDKLCRKYGGSYRIYCPSGNSTVWCTRTVTQCPVCTSCKIGATPCNDTYALTGPPKAACDTLDQTLLKKYGGGYQIDCVEGDSAYQCSRVSTSTSASISHTVCTGCSSATGTFFPTRNYVFIMLAVLSTYALKLKL